MSSAGSRRATGTRAALIGVLVILLLLLVGLGYFIVSILEPVGSPAKSELPEGIEWVRSIYGYGPSANQQFISPDHTEIGPDGTIWVSDTQLNSIFGFSPDGSLRRRIDFSQLLEEDSWTLPKGISVSPDGEIFVCGSSADRIFVVSEQGELLRSWDVAQPLDCRLYGDRLYVTGLEGVSVFSTDGEPIGTWGGRGKSLDELDLPQGVVVGDDGTVYVADTLNARVKAFDPQGALMWTTKAGITGGMGTDRSSETSGTGLQLPSGICIDGSGRLVLVDPFGFDIVVIDPADGTVIGRYGEFGSGDGMFGYPTGISYDDARDWFAVADTANDRVQIVRIPDSGETGVVSAVRRALVGPVWICAIPLVLLLLVALVAAFSKRRRPKEQQDITHDAVSSGIE
ncbi:MAG: NHL repeat-containing protein [Coriobacteriia bacterium]|nr:NHL repeat-containing protein [Coriobacteriia bacterium]